MKNYIFDLDGTLLDTLEDIGSACNWVLERHAYPVHDLEAYRKMVGNGFDTLMRRALSRGPSLNEEKIAALTSEAKNHYAAHLFDRTKPYPGIKEVLGQLVEKKKNLAVLSNKPDPMTRELIARFFPEIPFVKVCGAQAGLPLKPSPIPLLDIMEEFGWHPWESCYVGDSEVDVKTGKNAHVTSCAVLWGFRTRNELEREQPDLICSNPDEFMIKTLAFSTEAAKDHF